MLSTVFYITILTLTVSVLDANGKWLSEPTFRIVGGSDAEEGAFPYQVALIYQCKELCGGSIIDDQWILTAAHCKVDGIDLKKLKVVTGTTVLGDGSGRKYGVEKFIIHENFDKAILDNDIGLLKLNQTIEFNDKTKIIPLTNRETKNGKTLIVTGWGKKENPGPRSKKLQQVELYSTSISDCEKAYPERNIDNRKLCTTGNPGRGVCNGDSGGPLVYRGVQVGVVSFGTPCAVGDPDVHTNVKYYREWIKNNMRE